MADPTSDLIVKLAVLETKLDNILATLAFQFAYMEKKVDGVETDLHGRIDHERRNTELKFAALELRLAEKVDVAEFAPIKKTFWAGVMGVLAAVGTAVWALIQHH